MKRIIFLFIIILMSLFNTQLFSKNHKAVSDSSIIQIGKWPAGWCTAISVNGTVSYFSSNDTLKIVDFSNPLLPVKLKELDISSSSSVITDIFVNGNYVYVTTDMEGLFIINITNPAEASKVGFYSGVDITESVFVCGNYAYVSETGNGLYIVDISTPSNPIEVGHFKNEFEINGTFVNENYAFVANGSGGLLILDISNKSNPVKVASFLTGGYSFQVVVKDHYANVADGDDLYIIDVSDPSNPSEAGYLGTGGYFQDIVINENFAYLANGNAGLSIVDISNLSNIQEVGSFSTANNAIKLDVNGNYVYVAAKDAGLYVLENNLTTGINDDISILPLKFSLSQNYPNPFNPTTTIKYTIPEVTSNFSLSKVGLKVYDVLGNEIVTLVNETKRPGAYEVQFDATGLSSGVYFYRISVDNFIKIKKMSLIK